MKPGPQTRVWAHPSRPRRLCGLSLPLLLPPISKQLPLCFLSPDTSVHFVDFCVNGITQWVCFLGLASAGVIAVSSISVTTRVHSSFLFNADEPSSVWMCPSLCVHLLVNFWIISMFSFFVFCFFTLFSYLIEAVGSMSQGRSRGRSRLPTEQGARRQAWSQDPRIMSRRQMVLRLSHPGTPLPCTLLTKWTNLTECNLELLWPLWELLISPNLLSQTKLDSHGSKTRTPTGISTLKV